MKSELLVEGKALHVRVGIRGPVIGARVAHAHTPRRNSRPTDPSPRSKPVPAASSKSASCGLPSDLNQEHVAGRTRHAPATEEHDTTD
jgi:hypothetical protein